MTAYNVLSKEEAEDLRFILDDADMLGASGRHRERRMLNLWRRLHLWLLSEQGDRDAKMLLAHEFPDAPQLPSEADTLTERLGWYKYIDDATKLVARAITDHEVTLLRRRFKEGVSATSAADEILGHPTRLGS